MGSIFGASRLIGALGGQQFVLLHPGALSSIIALAERSIFAVISFVTILLFQLGGVASMTENAYMRFNDDNTESGVKYEGFLLVGRCRETDSIHG
ncbi:MAG: hypothetical protein P8K27_00490 [Gammaproteobacteria bacterium]|nr:hypothetical protein [Gammaproteobacteria bacterium]